MILQNSVLVERHNVYARAGLWPSGAESLNTAGWLTNFDEGEDQEIACAILDSFLLFSESVTKKLFLSAFHSLSSIVENIGDSKIHDGQRWFEFLKEKAMITYPMDTSDEATGSGPKYATLIRDSTSVPSENIMRLEGLVPRMNNRGGAKSVVIVDDFAGSGNQFIKTWNRPVSTRFESEVASLATLEERGDLNQVFYVVAVATEKAINKIHEEAPIVKVISSYVLDQSYSLNSENSILVPKHYQEKLPTFLERYTRKAGYSSDQTYGFDSCGFAVGFSTSLPDNNLAILQKGKSSAWKSLRGEY